MPFGWVRNTGGASNRAQATERNLFARQSVFDQVANIAVPIVDDGDVLRVGRGRCIGQTEVQPQVRFGSRSR